MEGGPRDSSDGRNLSAEAGVIPRSIKQIFDTIEGHNMDSTVKVSLRKSLLAQRVCHWCSVSRGSTWTVFGVHDFAYQSISALLP